ncbi:hypothetical protein ACFQ7B_03610 [Streptomyces erythrochromogenes]|uniref:hypothetical protein n=1 Tax=Streptomyces erythrochromogenes TaxID=285574 RepID=UPI0036B743BC
MVEVGARTVIEFFFTEVYNVEFLLPGQLFLGSLMAVRRLVRGGAQYLREGDEIRRAVAKNRVLYGLVTFLVTTALFVVVAVLLKPGTIGVAAAVLPAAMSFLFGWWVLSMSNVPGAVAAYSSWWMPPAERFAHREDMLYALLQTDGVDRSRHAWGLIKSSPRAGLRERRRYTRLASGGFWQP